MTKYKVGDRVRIKSLEWYEANKNKEGSVATPATFVESMTKFCGNEYVIERVQSNDFYTLNGGADFFFDDEMIECLVEDPKDEFAVGWSAIPEEYKYVAVDRNGDSYAYRDAPYRDEDRWDAATGGCMRLYEETPNWEQSLRKRPVKEEERKEFSFTLNLTKEEQEKFIEFLKQFGKEKV